MLIPNVSVTCSLFSVIISDVSGQYPHVVTTALLNFIIVTICLGDHSTWLGLAYDCGLGW